MRYNVHKVKTTTMTNIHFTCPYLLFKSCSRFYIYNFKVCKCYYYYYLQLKSKANYLFMQAFIAA